MTATTYLWNPAPVASLPVRGKAERLPVNRLFFVGRNYPPHEMELVVAIGAAIEIAVPMLVVAAIALPDEHTRLLAFGIIVAGAFAAAAPKTFLDTAGVMVAAVLLLRWIPLGNVEVFRELI